MGKRALVAAVWFLVAACGSSGGDGTQNPGGTGVDTTRPTVVSTDPPGGASGASINAPVRVTFSEPIDPGSAAGAFSLAAGATAVAGTVSVAGATLTFTPTSVLGMQLAHTATLSTGIRDLAGNALAAPYSFAFTTGDCGTIQPVRQFDLGPAVALAGAKKALATDGTSIYVHRSDSFFAPTGSGRIFRVNPTTGVISETHVLPMVPMGSLTHGGIQFIADIAWHAGSIWASGTYVDLAYPGTLPQGVFRVNLGTGLAESGVPVSSGAGPSVEVPILQGLASDGSRLYAAIDRNPANHSDPSIPEHVVVGFVPASSTQIPLAPPLLVTRSQITRLDHGGGFLWLFENPRFHRVDPATGAILATYCMTDGGDNLLFLDGLVWSIGETVLRAYSLQ